MRFGETPGSGVTSDSHGFIVDCRARSYLGTFGLCAPRAKAASPTGATARRRDHFGRGCPGACWPAESRPETPAESRPETKAASCGGDPLHAVPDKWRDGRGPPGGAVDVHVHEPADRCRLLATLAEQRQSVDDA
jgi:hypothetical protein